MKTQSNRLTFSQQFFIATMLFGLFFGAGNLIFPIFLGSQAGRNVWPAIVGLLITGVGIPLLGVAAQGMSRNTVAKYVRQLEEKGLIRTERTTVTLKDGRKRNGSLLYTILPPEQAVEQFNRQQLAKAEAAAERRRIQDTLAKQAAEAPPSPL